MTLVKKKLKCVAYCYSLTVISPVYYLCMGSTYSYLSYTICEMKQSILIRRTQHTLQSGDQFSTTPQIMTSVSTRTTQHVLGNSFDH